MPRPKPDITAVPLLIRFPEDALAEIDKVRGDISRQNWIRTLVVAWAADRLPPMSPAQVGATMRALSERVEAEKPRLTMDDVRPAEKPGSRLKGPKR